MTARYDRTRPPVEALAELTDQLDGWLIGSGHGT
jgi:hypothetical protein